ncbi:Phage tail fibre repeat-containing protein [Paenibacillus polysaccharolyticus]|uniref:Phage tail fibre repeat-containing protein n=1 Tax=Paenibacillus polysaccharolyticus TaxID=582692 RepID=A0A1G5GE57_9BACL|nr:pyocin knob domain-containing protein [Paenibacillus polysaccharolyticus]SCY49853.1 Phage tail fibre repeat-containing protein [Paenibacillus polysaccharolyticus]
MPQETDRLKLPLPLGNETVTRESINGIFEKIDAGVATQADLDTLREAVSKMDIPDASLTQKGKVQLSSKTDGTSETVAATEKAVRDARVAAETNAKNASLPRTGGVMTGRLIMNQWGTFSASSNGSVLYGSNCFLDGNTFKYENSHTNLGARGIYMRYTGGAGPEVYMFDTGPVATTAGTSFVPTLNRIVNMGDSLQKHRVSQDDGRATDISGQNLNNILQTGWYKGNSLSNSPSLSGGWGYVEVIRHDENWVLQKVYDLHADRFYMRRRMDSGWTPWTQDLFQSGVDAKNGIVGAINAKGGSASTSDTWAILINKVEEIKQSNYQQFSNISTGRIRAQKSSVTVPENRTITTFPAGSSLIVLGDLKITSDNVNYTFDWIPVIQLYFKDQNGVRVQLNGINGYASLPSGSASNYVYQLSLSTVYINKPLKRGQVSGNINYRYGSENNITSYNITIPENFDTNGPIELCIQLQRNIYPNYDQNISEFSQYFVVTVDTIVSV